MMRITFPFRGAAALTLTLVLAACGGGGGSAGTPVSDPSNATIKPNPHPTTTVTSCSANGIAASNASAATNTVCMLTSDGEIVIELYPAKAPITVANFLKYVNDGFYSSTLMHRVVKDFVVQGGGYTTGNVAKTATYAPIALESNNGLSNLKGTLAMARTSVANSATSQFFINTVDNSACLDHGTTKCDSTGNGYAVFGKVISGQATVDAINIEPRWIGDIEQSIPATEVLIYWVKQLR